MGSSNTDNLTYKTTGLHFSGKADPLDTVTLFSDVNGNGVIDSGELLASGVAASGNWSFDISLPDGTYNIRAIATSHINGASSTASAATVVTTVTLPPLGFAIASEVNFGGSILAVAAAGDVNGDGLADVILGAKDFQAGTGASTGRSYVVFGKAGDIGTVDLAAIAAGTSSSGFALIGELTNFSTVWGNGGASGTSVSAAGDVNGDGLADLIVGAPNYGSDLGHIGRSYVVFGKTDGAVLNLSDVAQGIGGFAIDGAISNNGISVSSAGDINGDGLSDLIVGARYGTYEGRNYVVFGKADGAAVDLGQIDNGIGGFAIRAQYYFPYSNNGTSVASAGDVNGDGLVDLLVSAPDISGAGIGGLGRSYVVFGKPGTAAVDLNDVAMSIGGFAISPGYYYQHTGVSVSAAGDVNGDGLADVVVGADYYSDSGYYNGGRSYVVFGKAGNTADVDLSALGTGGFAITGSAEYNYIGTTVSGAGDVNGDGLADVIVAGQSGTDYVVFGKADNAEINLSALGTAGFAITGLDLNSAVSGAGDVNGDGLADLIVGANAANGADSYVVFGKADSSTVNLNLAVFSTGAQAIEFAGNANANTLTGTSASETFVAGAGNDILTGNGGADVMYGGAGDDTFILNADNLAKLSLGLTSGNLARVDGGSGFDTLALAGSGINFDLSAISNVSASSPTIGSRLSSIERIDLTGSGNNNLHLNLADVLDLTEFNVINSGTAGWTSGSYALSAQDSHKQLVVTGNAGDTLNTLAASWTLAGTVSYSGATYDVYNAASGVPAQLLVDQHVQVVLG